VRAIMTAGGMKIPASVLDEVPSLGTIICYGTGYDGLDFAELKKRNIIVGHSPAVNAAGVADIAVMLMLAARRQLIACDAYVRDGRWFAKEPSPMKSAPLAFAGKKVGIYGLGEIGRKIAARCAAFETQIGYFSRSRHDVPYTYFPSIDALAEWADIFFVAVRASKDTEHLITADVLKKLGPDGTIINISRGSVIDQKALIAALETGVIASAGLDVYDKEPHAPDALTRLPNVVFTPHIGGNTAEGNIAMQECVVKNLDAFFAGQPLPYPVTV
jgi:lactate dehydrogenase-like 2-hydroxyacid dehydrogenase